MKRLSIAIILLISSFSSWAQSKNPPVIALDKMNVLYYGIDNEISIGAPVDFSQVKVSVVNGSISGEGHQRIIRPDSVDKTTSVIVDINGNKTTHDFRVKSIPNPSVSVGTSMGGRIHCGMFKAQPGLHCQIQNFEYHVPDVEITSYTAVFSGAGFDDLSIRVVSGNSFAPIRDLINRCKPGNIVVFDEITAKMPDGGVGEE